MCSSFGKEMNTNRMSKMSLVIVAVFCFSVISPYLFFRCSTEASREISFRPAPTTLIERVATRKGVKTIFLPGWLEPLHSFNVILGTIEGCVSGTKINVFTISDNIPMSIGTTPDAEHDVGLKGLQP